MAYYDNLNSTLLDLVEPSARRICEFGCGAGTLARAIKDKNHNVHYIGVELMADQLAMAKDILDVALNRNLDQLKDWSQDVELMHAMPLSSLDHVIFGDVLEHLYDPQQALSIFDSQAATNALSSSIERLRLQVSKLSAKK